MPEVVLKNGVKFPCRPNETVLDAAEAHGVVLKHSCKTGRCGICMAKLIEGTTQSLGNEDFLSDNDDVLQNILTCRRTALTDIKLNISDLSDFADIKKLILPCRIKSIDLITHDTLHLRLKLPPNNQFKFLPGQYINLIAGEISRSYSIANTPSSDGGLELLVKRVDGGLMSDYLFDKAKVNDLLRIDGPHGTFCYRDDGEENVLLLATGVGIAPIKALLEESSSSIHRKNIFVVWGGRQVEELFLDIHAIHNGVHFLPVLSREKRNGYGHGYVQNEAMKQRLNLKATSVYACGSELMIKEALALFKQNGLPTDRFYSDAFVSSN